MGPLPSGRYTITNARFKNLATLLNGNQGSDIVSGVLDNTPDAIWNIVLLRNNNYTIKNCNHGSFVNRGPIPEHGDSVFGHKSFQQWKIKETMTKGQYVIYPSEAALVCWGLGDGEIGTPIQFASAANDSKNQWIFTIVPHNGSGAAAIEQEDWIVSPSDVEFGDMIGEGGFGAVFKGTWHKSIVALKVLTNDDGISPTSSTIRHEIKIWSKLRHPNVLQFLGANVSDGSPFIVMPLMNNGNARDYIDCNPDCNRLKILCHITLGLLYLHKRDIVHGDLKSLNVLIDDGANAVLCDFGLSRIKADVNSRTVKSKIPTEATGSRNWMSPERLTGNRPTKPSDIYAFGMIVYEIHTNEFPLGHIHHSEFKDLVINENVRPTRPDSDEAPQMTDDCWQLAEDCWQKDPHLRPTIDSVYDKISQFVNKFPIQHPTKSQRAPAFIEPPPLEHPLLPLPTPQHEPELADKPPPSELPPLPTSQHAPELVDKPMHPSLPTSQHSPEPADKPPPSEPPSLHAVVTHSTPKTSRLTFKLEGNFNSVSFSPDGKQIISGSNDGSARVWDVGTRKVIKFLENGSQTDRIFSTTYSPNGKLIISGSSNSCVRVWDASNPRYICAIYHTDWVLSVAFAPDGMTIASGTRNGTIRIRDPVTGHEIRTLTNRGCIHSLVFSPNGQYLVAGAANRIEIWEVGSWRSVRNGVVGCDVLAVAVSPDSKHVAYSRGNNVRVGVMGMKKRKFKDVELQGHTEDVRCLAFSHDGMWVASGSADGTTRIWDRATGNSISTLEIGSVVNSISISSQGTQFAIGCNNGIHVFSVV